MSEEGKEDYSEVRDRVRRRKERIDSLVRKELKKPGVHTIPHARDRVARDLWKVKLRQERDGEKRKAGIDPLTELYNRRRFLKEGQRQLKMADRLKRRIMLLFADFDDLKRINDTLGHPVGDQALIETAKILKETFRESDIIARIGGDEFVVLAIETDEAEEKFAKILTDRLQEKLDKRNAEEGRRYQLSLSVGAVAYDPEHPCSIDELLKRADRLMYEQKQPGRTATQE